MTNRRDPYGVLGVPSGAPMAEVKRAYRLLVKRNHPDAAAGSLARFLEIQAAYESLVRGDSAGGRPGVSRSPDVRPARPASRPAASGQRGTRPAAAASQGGPAADAGRGHRPPGAAGTGERGRQGRGSRKATLGSTTYDEADGPFEPGWDGAAWYGPASGTYWTVNPKEYADPRKHGPEYLARARTGRASPPRDPAMRPAPAPPAAEAPPVGEPASDAAARAAVGERPVAAPAGLPRHLGRLLAAARDLVGRRREARRARP